MKIIELLEAANAPLYHVTTYIQAYDILKGNKIEGRSKHKLDDTIISGISLTRDLTFAKWWSEYQAANVGIIFQLNQEKLRHKYKILPIDYFTTTAKSEDPYGDLTQKPELRRKGIYAESEEFLMTNQIENFDRYIDAILIPKASYDKIDRINHSAIGSTEGMQLNLDKLKFIMDNSKTKII